jgi:hypothetical protein
MGIAMFGKPDWFHFDARSPLPHPQNREGRIWYGVWAAVLSLPVLLLLGRGQVPEAMVWLLCAGGAMYLEVRQLRADHRNGEALARLHYIGDDGAAGEADPTVAKATAPAKRPG